MFTEENKLRDILECKELKKWSHMIDPGLEPLLRETFGKEDYDKVMKGRRVADIPVRELLDNILTDWNMKSVLEGLNYLIQESEKRKVFYPIYTAQECIEVPSKEKTGLAVFPVGGHKPYIMICPGGGYSSVCSIAEGYGIAKYLNELGYNACVAVYRVDEYAKYPNAVEDLGAAIKTVQENSEKWGIDAEHYAIMGFSAGGHLASFFGTEKYGYLKYGLLAPECLLLGYPVINLGEYAHEGSRRYFIGTEECEQKEKQKEYSVENLITEKYPKVFVWQCESDGTVPVQNSRLLVTALEKNNISYEYELFPGEAHGWGLGVNTPADGWVKRAVDFWNR